MKTTPANGYTLSTVEMESPVDGCQRSQWPRNVLYETTSEHSGISLLPHLLCEVSSLSFAQNARMRQASFNTEADMLDVVTNEWSLALGL